ncbi:MAG: DHH family phosphoesterase [Nitrososphaeria archaeon]|nr:DHH family phosphoesterase [Nitrososphaeria archaeon]
MVPEKFRENVKKIIDLIGKSECYIVHHDDADGLSSAAVLKAFFERRGVNFRNICLEKLFPKVVEKVHERGLPVVYADLGSPHADTISQKNICRRPVLILDHHDPRPCSDPLIFDLNLEHYGFSGERDFSASTVTYLFSSILEEKNFDLAYLAIVGSKEIPAGYIGLNAKILDEAIRNGVLEKGRQIKVAKLGLSVDELFSALQIYGSVGYYRGGPNVGIRVALEGFSEESKKFLDKLEGERRDANRRLLAILYRSGLNETKYLQYFDSRNMFKGMGSKVLGTFCSYLSYQKRLVKANKYLLGYMDLLDEVPGFGRLNERLVKVSVRVPEGLREAVEENRMPSAIDILGLAEEMGGFSDGHEFAASCVIPKDSLEEFIVKVDGLVEDWVNGVRRVKRKAIID